MAVAGIAAGNASVAVGVDGIEVGAGARAVAGKRVGPDAAVAGKRVAAGIEVGVDARVAGAGQSLAPYRLGRYGSTIVCIVPHNSKDSNMSDICSYLHLQ